MFTYDVKIVITNKIRKEKFTFTCNVEDVGEFIHDFIKFFQNTDTLTFEFSKGDCYVRNNRTNID